MRLAAPACSRLLPMRLGACAVVVALVACGAPSTGDTPSGDEFESAAIESAGIEMAGGELVDREFGQGELGQHSQAIIGGTLDESTNGVVGLALDFGGRLAGHCSGTLIAPNLVLTARHCVSSTREVDAQGVVDCDTAEFTNTFPARTLLASPEPVRPSSPRDPSYIRGQEVRTLGDERVCGSDIALIILSEPVPSQIVPIAPRLVSPPGDRELFSTVGYGLTIVDDPGSDGTRQRADGSAVRCTGEECVSLSGGEIQSSEWASVDAPICSGDSGGPAIDEAGRVFGVASRGDPNCEVAVYGNVANWAPFIVDTALDAARIGDYSAPDWTELPLDDDGGASAGGCALSAAGARAPGAGSNGAARFPLAAAVLVCAGWWLRRTRNGRVARP